MSEMTLSELRGPVLHDPLLRAAEAAFPAAAPRSTLHRLLDEGLGLPSEFGGGMSNHYPMALHALDALGADGDRLEAFAATYRRMFDRAQRDAAAEGVRPVVQASAGGAPADWTEDIGRPEAEARLCARFAAALAREGRDPVLHRVLPRLLRGVAAHAFHGPIRVAHAVEAGHEGELARALAYWAAHSNELPVPEAVAEADRVDGVEAWLDDLDAAWTRLDSPPAERLPWIQKRVLAASHWRAYRARAGALRTRGRDPHALLQALALAAARRYTVARNLTLLHLVTTMRALVVLTRWLPLDAEGALDPVLHAVAAASLAATAQGLPARPGPRRPLLRWGQVLQKARASDDDHVVKVVHALWTLESTREHPDGLLAANRAVEG